MKSASTSSQSSSKSRHRDSRLAQRERRSHTTPLAIKSGKTDSTSSVRRKSPPTSFDTIHISDDELEARMDHMLHKNYTKTDPLTLSTLKATEFVTKAASAQQHVLDRAKRADDHETTEFMNMEVCATSLYQSIPIQKKASKVAQITFI